MAELDDCCGRSCCYSLKDFCWCLLCILIIVVIVVVVVLVVAFGFVSKPAITVENASLTRFALVNTPTMTGLAYNLSLTLTVRNRNWAMAMTNTENLDATLASGSEGSTAGTLGNAGVAEFRKENATGTFEVEVAVTGKVKYTARITKCKIEATCSLKLQLAPPGQTSSVAVVFEKVKCKLAKAEKNC
ncbi:hypothetical protein GUJ93_ZPchr0007g5265 [Zizania palustris]|uniref:Late embryogenesis abundant protein LEA-2 subgroup domain-containing protein n=1 Tax=Zizania palustris TaxID=103762 RepID=A0A8J5VQH2_ZIZPA|nr:hypothetical protein GUJ93_ZPchr0007g5265 [Zizania palustris]